ncbi:MAG: DUF4349 domain-containing protein [Candidatus Yanofskybacteria bacterium]|nr:DUF4349 domain-containing protein [Candidatus Yanofskybacteria bacterium]
MANFFRTIEEVLADWGRRQRQLPSRNELLKSEILNKLQATEPMLPKILPQHWHTPWLSFAFTSLALISLFVGSLLPLGTSTTVKTLNNKDVELSSPFSNSLSIRKGDSIFFTPPQGYEIPITDNREFTRTDYSANIRTRRVDELVENIGDTVRFLGGRVDSSNSSKQYGHVSFVVPADKFESFRRSVKRLAGGRFLIENIYTENLLPQKQSIEQQQKNAGETLTKLRSEKNSLISNHKKVVAQIQSKINEVDKRITAVRIKLDVTNDPSQREILKAEERRLLDEKNTLEAELANENSNYSSKLYSLDLQIRENEAILDSAFKEDQKLVDTVATVRGTVSLGWISVWEIIRLYVPVNFGFVVFGIAAIAAYLIHRRRSYLFLPD